MSAGNGNSNGGDKQSGESSNSKPTEKNFDLEDVLRKEVVPIKSYTDQTLLFQDWKKVERSIKEGISEECLYLLLSMACHLANPEDGRPLMAEHYPNTTVSSAQAKVWPTFPIRKVPRTQANGEEANQGREDDDDDDADVAAKAACYLSATLMKLITKPVDNYRRSLDRIANRFESFYQTTSSTVNSFKPSIGELTVIKYGLSSCADIRNTLVNHVAYADTLYQDDSDRRKLGLLRFVIVQHLEFTGMAAYQMFVELIPRLTVMTTAQVLTRLVTPDTEDCIDEIYRICTSFDWPSHTEGSLPSRFWRYARVVDPGYFLKLQPKRNILAMAILSELCFRYCNTDHRNMAVLANQGQIKKDAAKFVDDFDYDYVVLAFESDDVGSIWKMVIEERIKAKAPTTSSGVRRAHEGGSEQRTDTVGEEMDAQTEQVPLVPEEMDFPDIAV